VGLDVLIVELLWSDINVALTDYTGVWSKVLFEVICHVALVVDFASNQVVNNATWVGCLLMNGYQRNKEQKVEN
jgi:hypothetical protein